MTTFEKIINTAIKGGYISSKESSAQYIMAASKEIAKKYDMLSPEEQKVERDVLYKLFLKKIGKNKPKFIDAIEQTTASSSGSVDGSLSQTILKKDMYKKKQEEPKEGEFTEATDSSSSGAFDVPAFGKTTKGGRRDPLKIDGVKSIAQSRAVKDKNFPKWGGPDSVFIKIKDKCKKFPYCNQGDIRAIEPLREAIDGAAKKYGLSNTEVEKMILNEIKQIFI